MLRRNRPTTLVLPLLIATMAVLLVLAGLQYHWVGQVSLGERERREAHLAASAQRLSEDFNRELARAYLTFQMDAATLRDQSWQRYAQRYDGWFATAPYPNMIKAVYLVEVNQIGRVKLSEFDPATKRFDSLAWPYEMIHLRRDFERTYRTIFANSTTVAANVEPVDGQVPALLIPVARPGLLSVQQDLGINADLLFSDLIFPGTFDRCASCPPELFDSPLFAHTIVMLDHEYIVETMLPDLIEHYFPHTGGQEYNIGVIDRADADRLLFGSQPDLTVGHFADADSRLGLFTISYDDLNALILAGDPRLENGENESDRIAIGVLGRPEDEDAFSAVERGQWQLLIQHRDGSLEAAVNRLQSRNLLISFGILILLGISLVMLVLTTRRAQLLAERQIEFASAVSHELRTPLAVICSAGDNLADGLIHEPQQARRYGAVIANEGRRLTEMVDQVLAFAEAHSRQRRNGFHALDPAALLHEVLAMLQHQIRAGGFHVDLEVPPGLPTVHADGPALRRAIQNLLSNAMKYGGDDGWIGVRAAIVAVDRGAELQIAVSDHGAGVDATDLPHLFEPFYRGREATERQIHGSGLGLSLVQDTLIAHGGRVSVESEAGRGSCFRLHLPLPASALPASQQVLPA
ncbi:MAG: HAMP domain-containing histidine kinase [Oscillochloris sp.]|nr:HAMP domain-containing histidine kinase [Oscillochloris sp.]